MFKCWRLLVGGLVATTLLGCSNDEAMFQDATSAATGGGGSGTTGTGQGGDASNGGAPGGETAAGGSAGDGGSGGAATAPGGAGGCPNNEAIEDVSVEASDDATLLENEPSSTQGDGQVLKVTRWVKEGYAKSRAVIQFELDTIPSDAAILTAELCLTLDQGAGHDSDIALHRIQSSQPWSDANASWNEPWNVPGGDFLGTASAVRSITAGAQADSVFCFDVIDDVEAFHQDAADNQGWMIKDTLEPDEGGGETQHFASSNNQLAERRPILNVTYQPCD